MIGSKLRLDKNIHNGIASLEHLTAHTESQHKLSTPHYRPFGSWENTLKLSRFVGFGVAAWRHGPLADDVSLVIVEVR